MGSSPIFRIMKKMPKIMVFPVKSRVLGTFFIFFYIKISAIPIPYRLHRYDFLS